MFVQNMLIFILNDFYVILKVCSTKYFAPPPSTPQSPLIKCLNAWFVFARLAMYICGVLLYNTLVSSFLSISTQQRLDI